jgi:hypothetical protein
MWRMISRFVTTTLTATLAFAGLLASEAGAATIMTPDATVQSYSYSTDGNIASQTGVAPITFISPSSQAFTTPGTFSLGQFDAVNMLPASATLTYNNTPFIIDLNVPSGNGMGTYTYAISGNLNGSITGSGSSTMVATVSSITGVPNLFDGTPTTPPFPASDLSVSVPQGINAPNALMGTDGLTTLYAQVSPGLGLPAPAPEPASIAIFGTALAAWGLRRRLARSKPKAAA